MSNLPDKTPMSAIAFNEETRTFARALEEIERRRTGRKQPEVREKIATELGMTPGTLENIDRRRTKGVRWWQAESIRLRTIRAIEAEIARLNAILELAYQRGIRRDAHEVQAALTALKDAQALMQSAIKN